MNAHGSLHSFSFSGQVKSVIQNDNNTLGTINFGDYFSGTFSYSDVPDSEPDDGWGSYSQHAIVNLSLGSLNLEHEGRAEIGVIDKAAGWDGFQFIVGETIDDLDMAWFGLELTDSTRAVFNDDSLPTTFDLSDFDIRTFHLDGRRESTREYFSIEMQLQNISPIPEPSTVSLFGLATAFIWTIRKRVRPV